MKKQAQRGATQNLAKKLPTLPTCAKVPGKGSVPSTGTPKVRAGIGSGNSGSASSRKRGY